MTAPTLGRSVCTGHTRYTRGCDGCRKAGGVRSRARTRLIAYDRWEPLRVDAAVARTHIDRLRAVGMTRRAIAGAAGVSRAALYRIASGEQAHAAPVTVAAILAVMTIPGDVRVSGLGTSRRLQALAAIGWDAATLAGRLGTTEVQVRKWRWWSQQRVLACVHNQVVDLYRQLSDQDGPSRKARAQAVFHGYAPPICWDGDNDLDCPQTRPKGLKRQPAPQAAVAGGGR